MIMPALALRCGALSQVDDAAKVVRVTKDGRRRQGSTSSLNKRTRKPRTESAFKSIVPSSGGNDRDPLSLVGSEFLVRGEYPLSALERREDANNAHLSRHSPRQCPAGRHRDEIIPGAVGRGQLDELDDVVDSVSTSTTSLSDDTRQLIHNQISNDGCHSLQQMQLRQEILQNIHGKRRCFPTCPSCFGELTYLFLRKGKSRNNNNQSASCVSAVDIHSGNESAKFKIRHLLPPVCMQCRTHLLFEGAEMKFLMMENFNIWTDMCRNRSDSEDEGDDGDYRRRRRGEANDNAGPYDFNNLRNAKIVIVGLPPTPMPLDGMPSPCCSNSTRSEKNFFPDCNFSDQRGMTLGVDTSALSTSKKNPYRRKGQINYEHNLKVVVDENVKHEQHVNSEVPDENRQDEAMEPVDCMKNRKSDGKLFSFDEDPFLGDDSGIGFNTLEVVDSVEGSPPLANNSTESTERISIHTASEERMILEHYSMKKEIASKQIAKDLLRGRELLTSKCDRCKMPLTQNRGNEGEIVCVTCLGVQRKAKRIAKQKRKDMEKATIEDLSEDLTDLAADVFLEVCESASMDHRPGKDSESLVSLDETRNLNEIEEGLTSFISSAHNSLETINYGSYGCDNRSSNSSIGLNALHDKPASKDSTIVHQSDYRDHDSLSQFHSNQLTSASQVSHATSFQSYHSSNQERYPAVEYSLSFYKEKTCQHHQSKLPHSFSNPYQASASEVSVCNVSSEVSSTRCPRNLSPRGQLYHSDGNMYQGSISELSGLQRSSILSDTLAPDDIPPCEMIEPRHQIMTTTADDQRESIPEMPKFGLSSSNEPRIVPSNAIMQMPNVMVESAERPHQSHVNTYQDSISEVSECQSSRQSHQIMTTTADDQRESIPEATTCGLPSSNVPRIVPSIAIMKMPNVMLESAEQPHQSHVTNYQDSISEVSACKTSRQSHQIMTTTADDQRESIPEMTKFGLSSSNEPLIVPSNAIMQMANVMVESAERPHQSHVNTYQDSILEVSACQRSPAAAKIRDLCNVPYNEITPSQNQQNDADVSDELYKQNLVNRDQKICKASSEESSTRCPRDLPSSEMTWPYETHIGQIRRPRGSDEDSISEKIIRLADSLREVANQLPRDADLVDSSQSLDSTSLNQRIRSSRVNLNDVQMKQDTGKSEALSEQGFHVNNISCDQKNSLIPWGSVHPIPSSALKKNDSIKKNTNSSSLGVLHAENLPSNSIQHSISVWSKQHYMPSQIPISPIAVDRESKHFALFNSGCGRKEVRTPHLCDNPRISFSCADPPGCRMDYCEQKGTDPPDDTSSHLVISTTCTSKPRSKPRNWHNSAHEMESINMSTTEDEWASPRRKINQANYGRDPSPERYVNNRTLLSRSIRKRIPSETKGKKSFTAIDPSLSIGRRKHSLQYFDAERSQTKLHPYPKLVQCQISSSDAINETVVPRRYPEKFEHDPILARNSIRMSVTPKTKGRKSYIDNNRFPAQTATFISTPSLHSFDKGRTQTKPHPYPKLSHGQSSSLDCPSWDSHEIDSPLQTAKSWGDSSMDLLFKQIDEIEGDFNSIVASLPSSDGQSLLDLKGSNDSLKSIKSKHSLVEICINNGKSFESSASADSSMVTDVVERMRRIKNYIEQIDSVDDGSDSDGCNSQGEMSELMKRLASAAESLRELNQWDN